MTLRQHETFGLQGSQRPRISSLVMGGDATARDAVAFCQHVGLQLDPWQEFVLGESLRESPDWKCTRCTYRAVEPVPCPQHPRSQLIHPWAAFESVLIVPRQNGKSELAVARMLVGLYLLEERLQIFTAQQFDTALEVFERLESVIAGSDDLLAETAIGRNGQVGRHSNGTEGVRTKSGARVRIKARGSSGARGFSCDTLYLDEAMILSETFVGGALPTLSARQNPQVWMLGSSPDEDNPTHDGVVLARRRHRALKGGDPSLMYAEWSMDAEHPERVAGELLDDMVAVSAANPGFGRRISSEYVANERRGMSPRAFAVERGGVGAWPDPDPSAGRVIPIDAWNLLADPGAKVERGHFFGLAVERGQARAAIGGAGMQGDLTPVGVVEHRRGTDWIVQACSDLQDQFPDSRLVVDPREDLGWLLDELERADVRLDRVDAAGYKDACGGFFQAVTHKTLRYKPPQPDLDQAVGCATTRPLLDAWKWDWASGPIAPLVAVTLALWGARTQGAPMIWSIAEEVAKLRAAAVSAGPEPVVAERVELPPKFVPLDMVPAGRGLFVP